MEHYSFEKDTSVQELDRLYKVYGMCHVVHGGKVESEFQEKKKPSATTKGISHIR